MKKILVTSALPYVNNVPHLGNLMPIISGDVYARFRKILGDECIFICGTDDHGTTAEIKAIEEGITPKELTDKYFNLHKNIYDWFNFEFEGLGRTSSEKNKEISKDIFIKLYNNGFIIEKEIIQMWDEKAKRFLSDRFIEGTCPHCKFEKARGDQCDNCGKLLDAIELINPKSSITETTPIQKKSKHLFIDLGKIENSDELNPNLTEWIEKNKQKWSSNAISTTNAWLKEGLRPRCISRDLKWGIPIPAEDLGLAEEYKNKVFYSWFDAPIGYISITAEAKDDWKDWWKNPEKTTLVQFMGKDNIPFHTILFPSFCIGAKDNYTLMNEISVNEYINYEGGKFSKSRGVGVFGDDAKNSGIPADVYRYYLMTMRPEKEDTDFEWNDFQVKVNKELIGNFGNLVNRTLTFIKRFSDGKVCDSESLDVYTNNKNFEEIKNMLLDIKLKSALKKIFTLSSEGNVFFQESRPWVKVKENKKEAQKDLAKLARRVKDLAILIYPYMPDISKNIFTQMNLDDSWLSWDKLNVPLPENHLIGEPETLFSKMEDEFVEKMQQKYGSKEEKFSLDMKIAKIKEVQDHPKADKLLVLKINIGNEERQLVAGLKNYYSKEDLKDKKIAIIANLKPAKLRGIESQGMLMAGVEEDSVKLLEPVGESGDSINFEGLANESKQITYEDFKKINLKIKDGRIYFDSKKMITSKDDVKVDLLKGKVF
ncbi:MAG: methionine--tRNA ligase [Nanobdellota archaeon]